MWKNLAPRTEPFSRTFPGEPLSLTNNHRVTFSGSGTQWSAKDPAWTLEADRSTSAAWLLPTPSQGQIAFSNDRRVTAVGLLLYHLPLEAGYQLTSSSPTSLFPSSGSPHCCRWGRTYCLSVPVGLVGDRLLRWQVPPSPLRHPPTHRGRVGHAGGRGSFFCPWSGAKFFSGSSPEEKVCNALFWRLWGVYLRWRQ